MTRSPTHSILPRRLALAVGAPVLLLLLAELACRALGVGGAERTFGNFSFGLVWLAGPEPPILRPHPTRLYEPRPGLRGVVRTDGAGFRGPEHPEPHANLTRIAVVGDSTAFGFGVFYGDSFVGRTASLLRARRPGRDIDVVAAACHGYSSWQNRLDLEDRVLPLDPQVVVLFLSGFNDSVAAIEVDDETWSQRGARADTPLRRVLDASRLVGALRGSSPPPAAPSAPAALETASSGRRVDLPRFEANVRAMVARVRDAGAHVAIMSHAFRSDTIGEDPGRGRYRERLESLARELGVDLIDGAAALDGGAPAHYLDRIHPNEDGHARLAAALVEYLTMRSPLQLLEDAAPGRAPSIVTQPPIELLQLGPLRIALRGDFAGDPAPRFFVGGTPADTVRARDGGYELEFAALPAGLLDLEVATIAGSAIATAAVRVAPPSLAVERDGSSLRVRVTAGAAGRSFELHVATGRGDRAMMLRRTFGLAEGTALGVPLTGLIESTDGAARGEMVFPLGANDRPLPRLHVQALVRPDPERCAPNDFPVAYPTNVVTLDD